MYNVATLPHTLRKSPHLGERVVQWQRVNWLHNLSAGLSTFLVGVKNAPLLHYIVKLDIAANLQRPTGCKCVIDYITGFLEQAWNKAWG